MFIDVVSQKSLHSPTAVIPFSGNTCRPSAVLAPVRVGRKGRYSTSLGTAASSLRKATAHLVGQLTSSCYLKLGAETI